MNLAKLNAILSSNDWSNLLNCNNVDIVTESFLEKFRLALDDSCSEVKIRRNKYIVPKQLWITPGLLKSIWVKNKLFKLFLADPSESNKIQFKKCKNCQTKIICGAKKRYYFEAFWDASNSPKKTWQLINSCLGQNLPSKSPIEIHNLAGQIIKGDVHVADCLNDHFASIGEVVNEKLQKGNSYSNDGFIKYLPSSSDISIFLTPVMEGELLNICLLMKKGDSQGLDGCLTNIVKSIMPSISRIMAHLINLAFSTGTFPSFFKSAKIIPLHKRGGGGFWMPN